MPSNLQESIIFIFSAIYIVLSSVVFLIGGILIARYIKKRNNEKLNQEKLEREKFEREKLEKEALISKYKKNFENNPIVIRAAKNFIDYFDKSLQNDHIIREDIRKSDYRTEVFHSKIEYAVYVRDRSVDVSCRDISEKHLISFYEENLAPLKNNEEIEGFLHALAYNICRLSTIYLRSHFPSISLSNMVGQSELGQNQMVFEQSESRKSLAKFYFEYKIKNEFYVAPKDWM